MESIKIRQISLAARINIIRAGVMGANDGIISVAGIVMGVANASQSAFAVLLSGLAGTLAGTISMAMGEWVSVSTQRDSEQVAMQNEAHRLKLNQSGEVEYIVDKYRAEGISAELATRATNEMMQNHPLEVAVRERYGFNPAEKTSAVSAAIASMISFPIGAALPLISINVGDTSNHFLNTTIAVVIALLLTGWAAAKLGGANPRRAMVRNVVAGLLTMMVTFLIGGLFK